MDGFTLARIQFAVNISFHILFPMITLYTVFMDRVFWGKARELTYGL